MNEPVAETPAAASAPAPAVQPPHVAAMVEASHELTKCLIECANTIGAPSVFMSATCQTYTALAKVNAVCNFLTDPPRDPTHSADERLIELITEQTKLLTQMQKGMLEQAKKAAPRIQLPQRPNPTPHGPNGRYR